MKLWEKLSANTYRLMAMPYLKAFVAKSPETLLKRSVQLLDAETIEEIRIYITGAQTTSGGFKDKAGKPDLYYTLFGHYLADALNLPMLDPGLRSYLETEIRQHNPEGVYLHCAAILYAKLGEDPALSGQLREKVKQNLSAQVEKLPVYAAFLNLLTCYYLQDFRGLYRIRKQLRTLHQSMSLPCSVQAALLVLQRSFNHPVDGLVTDVLSFYDGRGGFKANRSAVVADMLSTSVALYALHFANADLRTIKPDCLAFIDRLYDDGGFAANALDTDTDIEYTFYGLLALGALAERHE